MYSSSAERRQHVRQRVMTPFDLEQQNERMQQRQSSRTPPNFASGSPTSTKRVSLQQQATRGVFAQDSPGFSGEFDRRTDSPRTPSQYESGRNNSNRNSPLMPSFPFSPGDLQGERGLDASERMNFLYSRFYGYVRNATGWQHKMDFWITTLDKFVQSNPSVILFTPRQLEQHYEYSGIQPKCLRRVLVEMMRKKQSGHTSPDIIPLKDYFADFSWAAWGFDILFNKPFTMAFVLIRWSLSSMFSLVTASIGGSDSSTGNNDAGVVDPSIDDRDADAAEAARNLDDQADLVSRSNLDKLLVQLKRDIADKKVFSAQKFHSSNIFSFDEYTHELIPYLTAGGINDTRVAALVLRHLCSHFDAIIQSPSRQQPYHQQILSLLPNPEKISSATSASSKAPPVSTAEILIKLSPTLFPASAAALLTAPSLRDVQSSKAGAASKTLAITERDKVRRSLQLQIDKFEQQFDTIEHERERLREQAKEFVKAKRKLAALRSLRKSKLLQVRTETLTKHIDNLEHMQSSIEDAEQNTTLFEILKTSKRALEKAQSDITIEQVEQIMDDINERIELNDQIGDLLTTGGTPTSSKATGGKSAAAEDDQDLERELDELLRADNVADDLADSIAKLKVLDTSIAAADDDEVVEIPPPDESPASSPGKTKSQSAAVATTAGGEMKEKVAVSE